MSSGATRRRAALGLVVLAAGLGACIDLFHSTDFDVCAECGDVGRDATVGDAGKDGGRDSRGGDDAEQGSSRRDTGIGPTDAGDGGSTSHAGVDAGKDFCEWSTKEAAEYAQRACLWLGACVGNSDLNDYGTCYPLALQAYDCRLNPNQRVRPGPLHGFWEALWKATSCGDVRNAILGANADAACSQPFDHCGTADASGGGSVVVVCAANNTYETLVNCAMAGWTCLSGACANSSITCSDASPVQCGGTNRNTLHTCQEVEVYVDGGPAKALIDVGRDCTNFGAGVCFADGGVAGCLPDEAGPPCDASTAVTCTGDATAIGCATGHLETIECAQFGDRSTCYLPDAIDGGWAASSRSLASACLNPNSALSPFPSPGCGPGGLLTDNGGPSGKLEVSCGDAGFGNCMVLGTGPFCKLPP